jgi:hypothetical protein
VLKKSKACCESKAMSCILLCEDVIENDCEERLRNRNLETKIVV